MFIWSPEQWEKNFRMAAKFLTLSPQGSGINGVSPANWRWEIWTCSLPFLKSFTTSKLPALCINLPRPSTTKVKRNGESGSLRFSVDQNWEIGRNKAAPNPIYPSSTKFLHHILEESPLNMIICLSKSTLNTSPSIPSTLHSSTTSLATRTPSQIFLPWIKALWLVEISYLPKLSVVGLPKPLRSSYKD